MKIMTEQRAFKSVGDELFLTLAHPECGTHRSFKITNSLKELLDSKTGLAVKSICSVCGESLFAQLTCGEETFGFSGGIKPRYDSDTKVCDEIGLKVWK